MAMSAMNAVNDFTIIILITIIVFRLRGHRHGYNGHDGMSVYKVTMDMAA